jgi:3-isopropylmalate/(R)-2-methylmalate dehydratase large subunit
MGKTIAEKILARAAGKAEVSPGDYIEVTSNRPTTMQHTAPRKGQDRLLVWGIKPFDVHRIRIVDGHYGAAESPGVQENRRKSREWAKAMGIPSEYIYELGRQGAEAIITAEKGWALPGECIFQGVNGHSSTVGALGCFAMALSFGTGAYLIRGKTWIKVPETCKIVITGKLPKGVSARDISEYTLGQIGPSGAVGMVTEWVGPVIDEMEMDQRFCLCAVTLFTGAWTSIMNPDEKTIAWVRARSNEEFERLVSDPDAHYAKVYEFDVSNIEPQVVMANNRYTVKPVSEVAGIKINKGMIGTESNGWVADIRMAAEILEGRKIDPNVIMDVVPGSMGILQDAIKKGYISKVLEAECVLHVPGTDKNTPLGPDEIGVMTAATNVPGRKGNVGAVYLASPHTVAASCLAGKIADPRKYL